MKHFIIIVTIGLMALGSGMMLATRFAMPGARTAPPPPAASVAYARPSSRMPDMPSMPSMRGVGMPDVRMPSMPDVQVAMPDARDAAAGAGRAFGKATDTMAYYSDQAFGGVAAKAKRSVDKASIPELP